MLIDRLCSPALIYLAFSIIQLILDMSQKNKILILIIFSFIFSIDSDGDGYSDKDEIQIGTDPNNNDDKYNNDKPGDCSIIESKENKCEVDNHCQGCRICSGSGGIEGYCHGNSKCN